jgi:2-polyprenyl-3-methyl-5-hydroxy-6-metoxy-1,4-benzoquinol methylase
MVCGDWLAYPEDQIPPADFVFCIEVLEHVPPELRQACIEKCRRLARKNVFVSTPPSDRNEHGQLTIPECTELLKASGLDVVVVDVQWTTMYVCSTTRGG